MTRNSSSANTPSTLTDAAGPGAGRTNPATPVYDTRPAPKLPAPGAAPKGAAIPRDSRKNSGGN